MLQPCVDKEIVHKLIELKCCSVADAHQMAQRGRKKAEGDLKYAEFDDEGNVVSLPKISPALLPNDL